MPDLAPQTGYKVAVPAESPMPIWEAATSFFYIAELKQQHSKAIIKSSH